MTHATRTHPRTHLRTVVVRLLAAVGMTLLAAVPAGAASDAIAEVVRELNQTRSVVGSEEIKSYPVLFKAYLDLTPPPTPVGGTFNHQTIHPGMSNWSAVSGWAESNPDLAKAILECEDKTLFGLPYGSENVSSEFREAGLVAEIGYDGSLRDNRFPYLNAIDTISAFATAEAYRLLEAGKLTEGLDLAVANIFVARQCCDREFVAEQDRSMLLLSLLLSDLRDMFYTYRDKISAEDFAAISMHKLPHLRPDRQRLLIAEGDRIVSEELIKEAFDDRGQPDRDKFAAVFAEIQSKDAPLTRFGAARRWRIIADVHDSEEASLERLKRVYDDWWRRWRIEAYDPILAVSTQHERTNPIRYAAVVYSMQNIQHLFEVRNGLVSAVYGTAMAGGLCGYKRQFGNYPSHSDKMYQQFVRKRSDVDPHSTASLPFKYRVLDERTAVDTPKGRIFIEPGECVLYSLGQDNEDDRGTQHTHNGEEGDILLWPAVRALEREHGLVD